MQCSVHYWFINVDITIPNFQVEATLRIGAYPCLIIDGRPLRTKIGQGHQFTGIALLTLGKTVLLQRVHLPTRTRLPTVYTKDLRFTSYFLTKIRQKTGLVFPTGVLLRNTIS